jgi:ribosomal protein L21E
MGALLVCPKRQATGANKMSKQDLSFGSIVHFDDKSFVVRAAEYFRGKTMLVNNRTGKTYVAHLTDDKQIKSISLAPWPPFIAVNNAGTIYRVDAEDRNRSGKVRAIGPFGNWMSIEVGIATNSMVFVK